MPPPPPPNSGPNYGQSYGQPQGYQPYRGGMTPQQDHPQGTTILILGILGLVVCQICGIVAWVMGNKAIKEIDANPGAYSNRGNVQAGRICGIVATCLLALAIVGFILVFALAASTST
jgi:hypothetical protein